MRTMTLTLSLLMLAFLATANADTLVVPDADVDPAVRIAILVVGVLAAILGPLAVVLGRYLAKRLEAATGLDLTKAVEDAARAGVGLAEQLAIKKLGESGIKMPGGDKLSVAVVFFLKVAEEKGWPAWVKEHAADYIESHLGQISLVTEPAPAIGTGRAESSR